MKTIAMRLLANVVTLAHNHRLYNRLPFPCELIRRVLVVCAYSLHFF